MIQYNTVQYCIEMRSDFNSLRTRDAIWCQTSWSTLVQVKQDAKQLHEPNLFIVNWTPRNKHQWKFHWNSKFFIEENAICKMGAILSWPPCVRLTRLPINRWPMGLLLMCPLETRQIRTPALRIPPAVTSQAKMKNWLHECQKWVSHMIGQYAHI